PGAPVSQHTEHETTDIDAIAEVVETEVEETSGQDAGDAGEIDDLGDSADAGDAPEGGSNGRSNDLRSRLVEEGDIAGDYLEGLLDIADLDGDLDLDVEGDRAVVSIEGGDLRMLVGRDGEVLDALQELTRLAVLRETGERSRLMLDIDGHRA